MIGLFLLAGCAGVPSGGQGPSQEDLGRIRPGVTTSTEVKAMLGQPVHVTRFDRMDRDVWEYRRYSDPFEEYHVSVQFSPDGVAREILVLKDYNREPCGP